jgi:imidazole glycerol-phosphate synthase subunit HisH
MKTKLKKPTVAIIDYKMGNMFSVQSACNFVGLNSTITSDKNQILNADAAILPGVGAFSNSMLNIKNLNLEGTIKKFIDSNKPFMGICLGMQLLFSKSEEFCLSKGLGIIPGYVKKFSTTTSKNKQIKVPQIGWNQVHKSKTINSSEWYIQPLNDIKNKEHMYFVHSFYVVPENETIILTHTNYAGIKYCSSIIYKNIFACQFHPEKSAHEGLKIYKNLAHLLNKAK